MKHLLTLSMLLSVPALAQEVSTLNEIRILGVSPVAVQTIRSQLGIDVGVPMSSINTSEISKKVEAIGLFRTTNISSKQEMGRNVLVIQVASNPKINTIRSRGNILLSNSSINKALQDKLGMFEGGILNTTSLTNISEALMTAYEEAGLPYDPKITYGVVDEPSGVTVVIRIDESTEVKEVNVSGATLVSKESIKNVIAPLEKSKSFDIEVYQKVLQALTALYNDKGYVGSGPDILAADLNNSVLKIPIVELKIGDIIVPSGGDGIALKNKKGDFFRPSNLAVDVQALENGLNTRINPTYRPNAQNPSLVDIRYASSNQAPEKIKAIHVVGNTVFKTADLLKILTVKPNDIYNLAIAQENYLALQKFYRDKGYELAIMPDVISMDDKGLTFNIKEVKIAAYEINWQNAHKTADRLILRELPPVGSVFNANEIGNALGTVLQTGFISSPQLSLKGMSEDTVVVQLGVTENGTLRFGPAISYSSEEGLSGDLSVSDSNVFGIGHNAELKITGAPNNANQVVGGSLSYTIPWIDANFLDFQRTRTAFQFKVGSSVTPNIELLDDVKSKIGKQYSQRSNTLNLGLSRPLSSGSPFKVNVGLIGEWNVNYLQSGGLSDTNALVTTYFPEDSRNLQTYGALAYDTSNNFRFPTKGLRVSGDATYGFGSENNANLSWWKLTTGARAYLGFGGKAQNNLERFVIAVRGDAGTIRGTAPNAHYFTLGGSSFSDRYSLKGFDAGSLRGSEFYSLGAELRYNFGVQSSFLQGLYGIAFVDAGDAWFYSDDINMNVGYGVGLQMELGSGAFMFPPIRMDYAFSEQHPSGKFTVKLGNFF